MPSAISTTPATAPRPDLKTAFNQAVGGTFYRQLMSSLRASTGKAAYFDGGQTEKIFRGQFDELVVEKLAEANGHEFAGPMYDQLQRQLDRLQQASSPRLVQQRESPGSSFVGDG